MGSLVAKASNVAAKRAFQSTRCGFLNGIQKSLTYGNQKLSVFNVFLIYLLKNAKWKIFVFSNMFTLNYNLMQTSDSIKVTGIIELPTKSKKKNAYSKHSYLQKCSVLLSLCFHSFLYVFPVRLAILTLDFKVPINHKIL